MFDAHVRQRNFIKSGLLMFTKKAYPNTWVFSGNYKPSLCRFLMERSPNAFAH